MNKWDNLCIEMDNHFDAILGGFNKIQEKWIQVRAEGDNMAFNYQKRVSICNQLYKNNKELRDTIERIRSWALVHKTETDYINQILGIQALAILDHGFKKEVLDAE